MTEHHDTPTTDDAAGGKQGVIDIDAVVRDFAKELDSDLDQLLSGGGDGDGGGVGGGDDGDGGGGGGGGDDDDDDDDERFYRELAGKLSKKLTKEEQDAILASAGMAIDKLPLTTYGHAIRMFRFADGHLMRRTTSKSRTGEWIMYRSGTGTWTTEAADDLIINRAMQVSLMFQRWAQQISKMLDDSAAGMSDAKATVLGMLSMFLLAEAEAIQKSKIPGIIRMARSIEQHHINHKRFDADPWKLAVANGVIDLRTGERIDHSPTNFITRHLDTAFIPGSKCPTWLTFMTQAIPDQDVRHWVQRFAGYCLTGMVDEQVAAFFHGRGGSGKSTLWLVIREILGVEFANQVHRGVFHKDDFTRYASSTIVGLRMGVDAEWEANEVLMTGKFRQLVGETTHTPEPKMQKLLGEVPITAKFVFLAQHLPRWDASDPGTAEAMRRRMFIIPMNQRLAQTAYTSSAYLDLKPNLIAESEGILAWLVEGEQMRQEQPLHVGEPQAMIDARETYFKELGVITVDAIQEALTRAGYRLDQSLKTTAAELNVAMPPDINPTALGRWLRNHGCSQTKSEGSRAWQGIGR